MEKNPAADHFDVFIVGGTPILIYDVEKHDFLTEENRYLEKILKIDKPFWGFVEEANC